MTALDHRYDPGITARKIAISIPEDLYATIRAKVDAGEAASVSGLITETLRDALTEDSLEAFHADLVAELGPPSPEDQDFAERVWAAAEQLEREGTWPGDVHR